MYFLLAIIKRKRLDDDPWKPCTTQVKDGMMELYWHITKVTNLFFLYQDKSPFLRKVSTFKRCLYFLFCFSCYFFSQIECVDSKVSFRNINCQITLFFKSNTSEALLFDFFLIKADSFLQIHSVLPECPTNVLAFDVELILTRLVEYL